MPDGDGLLDPEGAKQRLAAWQGRIDKLAADTSAMRDRMQELQVTLADDNGLAEVTVDASGVLVGLRLGARVQRVAPDVTARVIMETMQAARRQMAERTREIVAETMGPGSAAGRAVAAQLGQQLERPR